MEEYSKPMDFYKAVNRWFKRNTVTQDDPILEELPIEVRHPHGYYLSHCSRKRAAQLVYRQKARWLGQDLLELLITNKEEKEIRKRVLERDGYVCYICECQLSEDTITYDHIIPICHGGTDYENNLAICCQGCNEDKADRTPEQYVLTIYWRALCLLGGFDHEKCEWTFGNYASNYRSRLGGADRSRS